MRAIKRMPWTFGVCVEVCECDCTPSITRTVLSKILQNQKQRTVLNGQSSSWKDASAGVPQGSGQVHNAEPAEHAELAEFFFREIKFRVLSLRYRAKSQNAELAELDLNFIE